MRLSRMANSTRLYWLQIKDQKGVVLLFNTMDWTDDDRRVGVAEICRLAGLPEDNCLPRRSISRGSDKELDADRAGQWPQILPSGTVDG
jgi:hypothetical protein